MGDNEVKKEKAIDLCNAKFIRNGKHVNVEIKIPTPQKLYKFYALNENSIKVVAEQTIFFSPNNLLNDVLEGNFETLWNFDNFTKNESINRGFRDEIIYRVSQYKKDFLQCRGIFSMSSNYKNELLWIHYTNESGFCLEFDTEKLSSTFNHNNGKEHSYFFPISYYKPIQLIDFNSYCDCEIIADKQDVNALLPIMYCLAAKEYHWSYEEEWRLLINHDNFNYVSDATNILDDATKDDEKDKVNGNNLDIDSSLITKVILAPRFFNNSRFNKQQVLGRNIELLNFKDNEDGKQTQKFLLNLQKHYPNCIYQIEKIANLNLIERNITTKIEIIDISERYVKIKKVKL